VEDTNELIQERIKKLNCLREAGEDPYGGPFPVKDRAADIIRDYEGIDKERLETDRTECTVAGRILSLRNFGKAAFAHVQDASGRIQVYFKRDVLGDAFDLLRNLDIGDIVGLSGRIFRTRTDELTIEVKDVRLLCKSLRPLPEKWHGLKDTETRYRQRYVDLIVNPQVRDLFVKRSRFIKSIRDYFDSNGFLEVETPMMHQIPGGAAARPFKTHHNALGTDLFLRIAPELLNKNFRNEGISTKHNPEFTMLEFYIAYADYRQLMDLTEELVTHLCRETIGGLSVQFGDKPESVIDFTPPWPRLGMREVMRAEGVDPDIFGDIRKARDFAVQKGIDIEKNASHGKIIDEIFKEMVEPKLVQPTFILDYPVELSPLAKRKKDEPALVERFELFIGGREVANAFTELNDPADQRQRFLQQVEARKSGDEEANLMDEDFIRALEYGMPPAAGEGIGIDRLFMLLTNSSSIRDVVFFPQLKPEQ
jgi:lysyl-tRNA synthetase class 2